MPNSILFLRTDNLKSALSKMNAGGWIIYMDEDTFTYIKEKTGFDLKEWLIKLKDQETHKIQRQ